MGPSTSRVIAGAGLKEMGDVNEGWGVPQAPAGPTVEKRLKQLMQQMAQLCNENVQLRDDLLDL